MMENKYLDFDRAKLPTVRASLDEYCHGTNQEKETLQEDFEP